MSRGANAWQTLTTRSAERFGEFTLRGLQIGTHRRRICVSHTVAGAFTQLAVRFVRRGAVHSLY